jgi:biopolymer transport protein ExbD
MNLNKHDAQTEMSMNMTPMIDVVFLLIIFFMIITDLTQQELEDIQLPVAMQCDPDKPNPDEWRPIVNIDTTGRMVIRRIEVFNPEADDGMVELERNLSMIADRMKKKMDNELGVILPDDPLLIRADENTAFKWVQKIMEKCGKEDIRIWKLQLAAKEPPSADGTADQ